MLFPTISSTSAVHPHAQPVPHLPSHLIVSLNDSRTQLFKTPASQTLDPLNPAADTAAPNQAAAAAAAAAGASGLTEVLNPMMVFKGTGGTRPVSPVAW